MFKAYLERNRMFAADSGAGGGGVGNAGGSADANGDQGEGNSETLTFDTWLATQPDDVKGLLDGHTKGLKTALESEREIRKTREKELRDLAKKAEEGSEAQKQLTDLANQESETGRKADFYEAAHAGGVTNLRLAYLVAVQDELFDKKGNVDFDEMKKGYPELFGSKSTAAGNAGSGTQQNNTAGMTMDDFIRRKINS